MKESEQDNNMEKMKMEGKDDLNIGSWYDFVKCMWCFMDTS